MKNPKAESRKPKQIRRSKTETSQRRARSVLECGDVSPLSAGDGSPSTLQSRAQVLEPLERGAASPTSRQCGQSCDESQHSKTWRLRFTGFCFLLSALYSVTQAQYAIDWSTIDGGGGTSTGGVYSVSGTIGQPDAGTMSGGQFTLIGGFWALPGLVQTPGAPTLYITNTAPGWATIWWSPLMPGFTLQSSPVLAPAVWTDAPSGTNNPVLVPTTLPARLYRLSKS
jgi:hypothetical protein